MFWKVSLLPASVFMHCLSVVLHFNKCLTLSLAPNSMLLSHEGCFLPFSLMRMKPIVFFRTPRVVWWDMTQSRINTLKHTGTALLWVFDWYWHWGVLQYVKLLSRNGCFYMFQFMWDVHCTRPCVCCYCRSDNIRTT